MKLASRSVTAAVTVMVPNSLGPAELLLHYGTEEQRRHYLPRLATGEEIPCFTVIGFAFKLRDPDRLLGGEEELEITLALPARA